MARLTAPTDGYKARRGFTLAECLIATVVLATAVIGISATLSASYQQTSGQSQSSIALALARQLMEEIAAKPVELPASETDDDGWSDGVTNRALYDTIDDYSGYADTSSGLAMLSGDSISVGDGLYTRTATVTSGVRPTGHTAPSADFLLVKVRVVPPSGTAVEVGQVFTRSTVVR